MEVAALKKLNDEEKNDGKSPEKDLELGVEVELTSDFEIVDREP